MYKKILCRGSMCPSIYLKKNTKIILLMFLGLFVTSVSGFSQDAKVSMNLQNKSLENVFESIKSQTNYSFWYDSKDVDNSVKISISVKDKSVKEVLNKVLANQGLEYRITDNHIVITKTESSKKGTSQQKKVYGTILDDKGEPLVGVSIKIPETNNATITDVDGKYAINVTKGQKLVVSYVGYTPQSITIEDQNEINITLKDNNIELNSVVVTALGIKRETKALSYNVQQINGNDLAKTKDMNVMSSLAGKIAGVTINASASGIGGGARVVMRGTKSISGNNNALYVVDGIPLPNSSSQQPDDQYTGAGQTGDGIGNFNPDDIESISILSGSAAAALYGSAAANGVVLITTKKGLQGKTEISYSNNSTFYAPFVLPKLQNEYGSETGEWYSWSSKMSTPSTYNVKDFFQTGYNFSNTVSLSTGNEKNQTYISVGSVNARGIIPNNDLDRYNVSARNTSSMFHDKLVMDLNLMYSNISEQNMLSQGEYGNPLVAVYLFPRGDDAVKYQYYERYNVDRNIKTQFWPLGDNGLSMQNPYWITNRNMYNNKKDRFLTNASLNYKLTNWANVSGRVKLDKEINNSERKMYASTLTVLSENSDKGAYIETNRNTTQVYADAMLNIDKHFLEDKLSLTAAIGSSFLDLNHEELAFGGGLLTIPNLFTVNNVDITGKLTYINNNYHDQTNSVFGTASIGYKGYAFLDASLRNDWLSALAGTNHSSILYPSIGASAVLTDIFGVKSRILPYAKARVSYSEVGNAPERFRAITTYSVQGGLSTTSYFPIKDLSPERTHSWEAGLNLALFDNKLTLDVTAYKSFTENQLFSPSISTTTGYSTLYVNAGKVTNRGIELSSSFKQKLGPVNWKTIVLWTLNRNRIDQLLPEYTNKDLGITVSLDHMDVYSLGGAKQMLTVGGSMGDLYVNTMRTDEHGQIWINSMTGALETDKTNYVYAGNTNPKYNLSWRNEFNWKGLNLGFMITARIGGVGVSATQAVLDYYGVSEASATARDNGGVALNGQTIDAQTWYQTVGANGVDYIGSMYVYSMTNVRLGELTLGYDVPVQKWNTFVKNLNLSLVGHNLLMLYNKAPFDPESTASTGTYNQCMDYFMQPSLRSFGFSAKVTF